MTIIFYDANNNKIYLATDSHPLRVYDMNDPNFISFVPNDDILYVQSGSLITKKQLNLWLNGEFKLNSEGLTEEPEEQYNANKKYIHPRGNGFLVIGDIRTSNFPKGLAFKSKYDFVCLNDLGDDIIEKSAILRSMIKTGKIEVVDEAYVRRNMNLGNKTLSAGDKALEKILIPVGQKAEDVWEQGGLGYEDEPLDDSLVSVKILGT